MIVTVISAIGSIFKWLIIILTLFIFIDKVKKILGMDITIVTSANTTEEGRALLVEFGFPFEKK